MDQTVKFDLSERDLPEAWYNITPDLPAPPDPVLHPGTGQPIGPADLAPLFPMALIQQEVSTDPWIPIPEEVRDIYRLWRPTPLLRARHTSPRHGLHIAAVMVAEKTPFWRGWSTSVPSGRRQCSARPRRY